MECRKYDGWHDIIGQDLIDYLQKEIEKRKEFKNEVDLLNLIIKKIKNMQGDYFEIKFKSTDWS